MAHEQQVTPAPYLPLKTFIGALDSLREGVPKRIDRGIWRSQSGSTQGQIMIALRFFDLVNDKDEPSQTLENLAKANEIDRKKILKALVESHYRSIITHDLTKMTPTMLNEEMEKFGVSGGTTRKSVTFFLQTAKYLDLAMSPYLNDKTRTSPKRRAKAAKSSNGASQPNPMAAVAPITGSTASVDLKGGGTVTMTVTADVWKMPPDDRKFVLELVDKIQNYQAPAAKTPKEKAAGQAS